MSSDLQRVAQGLAECLDQIPEVMERLQRTAMRLRQQASWIADLAGSNSYGRQAALLLDDAARRCDEAAYRASLALPAARTWAQTMVGDTSTAMPTPPLGAKRPDTAGGRVGQRSGRTTKSAGAGGTSEWTDTDVAAVLQRLPRRQEQPGYQEKTRGLWRDDQGREHQLVSGVDDWSKRADNFAALRRLGRPPHRLRVTSHVEVKFAMRMREHGLRDATIVLNNEPCLGESGCDALLPDFLPAGASLTVYARDGYKNTYRGKAAPR